MIRRPPRSTLSSSSAASDVYKRQVSTQSTGTLLNEEKLAAVPLLIFANKMDLSTALPAADVSQCLNLHTIRDRKWNIQGCSAKTGDGLNEGLEWSVKNLK
eukprot:TRINITY_DN15217_c0_g1_i1.p1 TRINITY_DN15217_c0_g1~~TRINITY_DN15217_c0_g1_i1.p1  ORF type:complete len:101 (-),score=40.32 TRINITY_DN15217_c0_g1_i1:158-460(-)